MIIKHIRITNHNQLIDRFLTAQIKKSSDIKKNKMGKIFAVVEILNPWHPNAQIGQTIINTLTRNYYKSSNTNDLINFEVALKKVNESLAQIVQNGETDWMGKLNSLLAVILNEKIHLTYTGKAKSYLIRKESIMPVVSEPSTYPQTHPLKIFTNIISGKLNPHDKIILTSPLLFDCLSIQELKEIITKKSLIEAATNIIHILKTKKINNISCILIEILPSQTTTELYPEVIYIDQQKFDLFYSKLAKALKKIKPFLGSSGLYLKKIGVFTKEYYQNKIFPGAKKTWEQGKLYSQNKFNQIVNNTRDRLHKQSIKSLFPTKIHHVSPITNKKIINQTQKIFKTTAEQQPTKPNINYYHPTYKKINYILAKCNDSLRWLGRNIKNFTLTMLLAKNRSKLYVFIACILLVILITNISFLRSRNQHKEEVINYQEQLVQLSNKKDDAKLAILANQNKKALELLSEIQQALIPLIDNKEVEKNAQILAREVQNEIDKVSRITRLQNPSEIANFARADFFYTIDSQIYSINSNNNQIYSVKIQQTQTPIEIAKIPTSSGLVKTAAVIDTNLIVYTLQKKVYEYKNETLSEINPDEGSWSNATAIATYLNNLYFLDGEQGQIYKYTPQNNTYSKPSDYLDTNKVDVKNSLDLVIDGNIFVLKKDGSVVKLAKGQLQDFSVKNIPEPDSAIKSPKQIFTSEETTSLYILDSNRILKLDKSGGFIAQYAFPAEFNDIKYFSLDEKSKELMILNDNTIYKFGL